MENWNAEFFSCWANRQACLEHKVWYWSMLNPVLSITLSCHQMALHSLPSHTTVSNIHFPHHQWAFMWPQASSTTILRICCKHSGCHSNLLHNFQVIWTGPLPTKGNYFFNLESRPHPHLHSYDKLIAFSCTTAWLPTLQKQLGFWATPLTSIHLCKHTPSPIFCQTL